MKHRAYYAQDAQTQPSVEYVLWKKLTYGSVLRLDRAYCMDEQMAQAACLDATSDYDLSVGGVRGENVCNPHYLQNHGSIGA